MQRALILGRINGVGLDRDATLLAHALSEAGVESAAPPVRSLAAAFATRGADAAFHLERVWPLWKMKAKRHYLIPNQERYPARQIWRLRLMDAVLCKSEHAVRAFSRHHRDVRYLGFTSADRRDPSITPDYRRFLHIAGRSSFKGTSAILQLWEQHAEWPRLELVQHGPHVASRVPSNVNLIDNYLSDAELRRLQNECGVHLCPSVAEGWGHYIAEAMSCAAVTITTDAPPMNEIVTPSRGYNVEIASSQPRHLGVSTHVSLSALEGVVGEVMGTSVEQLATTGSAAREWFEMNDEGFRNRLAAIVRL